MSFNIQAFPRCTNSSGYKPQTQTTNHHTVGSELAITTVVTTKQRATFYDN